MTDITGAPDSQLIPSNRIEGMDKEQIKKEIEELNKVPMTIEEWRAAYEELQNNPPVDGDFLYAENEQRIKLTIECQQGKPPCVFARIFIPQVVGEPLGWFAQAEGTTTNYGWKCILLPKARNEVITRFGMSQNEIAVKSLRVVKTSQSGKSLLVEVSEF